MRDHHYLTYDVNTDRYMAVRFKLTPTELLDALHARARLAASPLPFAQLRGPQRRAFWDGMVAEHRARTVDAREKGGWNEPLPLEHFCTSCLSVAGPFWLYAGMFGEPGLFCDQHRSGIMLAESGDVRGRVGFTTST